jgi:hypothetical protein
VLEDFTGTALPSVFADFRTARIQRAADDLRSAPSQIMCVQKASGESELL